MINRERTLQLGIAAGTSALLRGRAAAQAPSPLVVATLPSTSLMNLYYGLQQGEFQRAGLDVSVQPMSNGAAAIAAVAGRTINLAVANVLSLAQAYQRGIPVRVIGSSGSQNPESAQGNQLLVAGDSPIRSAKDLEGKVVAVSSVHDIGTVALSYWLDKNGADHTEVSYLELPPNTMYAAVQSGRVAAMIIYDPLLSAAKAQGARVLAQPYDGIAPRYTVTAWFGIDPWISQNRAAALRFVSVLNRLAPYTNTHYEELVGLAAQYTKLPEDALRRMTHPTVLTLKQAPLQPLLDVAAKYKEIEHMDASSMTLPGAV